MNTEAKVKVVMQFYYLDAPREPPTLSALTVVINPNGENVPLEEYLYKFAAHFYEFVFNSRIVDSETELKTLARKSIFKLADMKMNIIEHEKPSTTGG